MDINLTSKNSLTYDEFYSKTDWKENPFQTKLYIKSLMRLTRIFNGGSKIIKILDVGCGTGIYTDTLVDLGYLTVGIDYSEVAIEKAKKKFPNCSFECQDANQLNMGEKFDLVFAKGLSLFNTKNIIKAQEIIKSWNSNLNIGGIIIIQSRTDFSQNSPTNWYFHSEDEIRKMFYYSEYEFNLIFIYSKLQYLFLLPLTGKIVANAINWISKNIVIRLFRKPVNYVVFLKKK